MNTNKDHELVRRIQDGDYTAENELFARFNSRIKNQVIKYLGKTNENWKEVVGEARMAILINLRAGKFNSQHGSTLGSYIFGITMNKVRNFYKIANKEIQVSPDVSPEFLTEDFEEEHEFEKEEMRKLLKDMMGKLNLKYQEVLYLRFYEDMSVIQISERIKLPKRRVSERIHYALKLLRKKCEKEKYFSILFAFCLIII